MGMTSRPQGASLAGLSGLGPPMGQPMNLPGQQPPGPAGMAPHGIPNIPAASQPSKYLGQVPSHGFGIVGKPPPGRQTFCLCRRSQGGLFEHKEMAAK